MDEGPSSREDKWIVGRALSIPVLAFLVALLLIYTRSPTADPCSAHSIGFSEIPSGENLCRALRSITIRLGLASLLGGLIGIVLGSLVLRSSKLPLASLRVLHIGQWAPFILWWPLSLLLLLAPKQQIPRYFLVWAIAVPAVALAACYQYLCARLIVGLGWRGVISEVGRISVLQGLFISLMLILSVRPELWMVYPGSGHTLNYAVVFFLVLFLIVVKWVYRSSLDYTAGVRKAILLGELSNRNQASLWGAMLLVLLCLLAWQLLGMVEYLQVSPVSVFRVFSLLVSEAHIWNDVRVSLFEIFGGLIISGGIALVISTGLSRSVIFRNLMLPLLPLTYVVPIVVPPALLGSFVINLRNWSTVCVAVLSFFPFMQGLWGLRDQPLLCRILLAVDDALPFAFVGIVYGEAMAATAGLGFWMVVATAKTPTAEPVATFIVTFGLLAVLSSALRFVVRTLYFREGSREILLAPETL